ncbi:MAG: lipoate--protein ligase [Clostridia bacterium]|nr:lipoate--protein ligase [Clostridia bacterium]
MLNSPKKVLFFLTTNTDPYKNIAFEYRLLKACPSDTIAVFLWQNDHSIIIGQNQNVMAEVNVAQFLAEDGKIVRRMTGGGAVYHDLKNLNFSFVAPKRFYDLSKNFEVIKLALKDFGIYAEVSGRNDLLVDGKKISGNAFKKEKETNLHHGTLLIDTDVQKMQKYLNVSKEKLASKGVKSVSSRVLNLISVCPTLTVDALIKSIKNALPKVFGVPVVDGQPNDLVYEGEKDTERQLRSKEWTYGRVVDDSFKIFQTRFAWGGIEVGVLTKLVDGNKVLSDLVVFSDSLNEGLSAFCQRTFVGLTDAQLNATDFGNEEFNQTAQFIASQM